MELQPAFTSATSASEGRDAPTKRRTNFHAGKLSWRIECKKKEKKKKKKKQMKVYLLGQEVVMNQRVTLACQICFGDFDILRFKGILWICMSRAP